MTEEIVAATMENVDTCPMCASPFEKPKLLPCMDTVCFSCLDEYVVANYKASSTIACPVCKTIISLPPGGVTKYEDNLHIKGDQVVKSSRHEKQQSCEVCDEKPAAARRCIDCEQDFCNACSRAHLRLNITKNHTLVSIQSDDGNRSLLSRAYCDKHTNEELTFYCRTCYVPVCIRCRMNSHEDHTTEDIYEFARTTRKELRSILDEGKHLRFSLLNEIDDMRTYGETMATKKANIKKAITQRRKQFHHAVDTICNEMLERLETETSHEEQRLEQDRDIMETNLLTLSSRIATANQIIDFASEIEVVKKRQNIMRSLMLLKRQIPPCMPTIKMDLEFTAQCQAEISLKYLIGRLSTDINPPDYISVVEISTFRVESSTDVINSICPSPDGKAWVACGWKQDIFLYDRYGQRSRSKRVGRDVDCLTIDSDGNCYVSCRDEQAVKRFSRNFKRRMATLNIQYPRGIATTHDNKLVICVNETTTYFDYIPTHKNKVLKLGPDAGESKELKNPSLDFMYPIRVSVNITGELCVSDNLKHSVMFLKPNGELKFVYTAESKTCELELVETDTPSKITAMTHKQKTSTPMPGFRLTNSRQEQDGPRSPSTSHYALEKNLLPLNSPTPGPLGHLKALAAPPYDKTLNFNKSFDSMSFTSGISAESRRNGDILQKQYERALTDLTGAMDSASVTECATEDSFMQQMPPFDPRGITCDRYGHVIVADYNSNMVHLLDKHGRFLMYLLTEADGIFGPTSVAVDNNGLLWVGGGDATVKIYRYISDDMPSFF